MKTILRGLVLASLLASGSLASARAPKVGEASPDFTLTMLDGSKQSFADLRGQVIVLNFWATWCGPCRTELPLLDGYYALQKKFGLKIIAVETQGQGSVPMYRLKEILKNLTMPSARRISGPYAPMGALPTNYVIDRKGVVRYARAGAFDLDALNALLIPLLKEPVPVATVVASAE